MRDLRADTWVVYQTTTKWSPDGIRAVCGQSEWEAMDAARPGHFTLIRGGIAHEAEAERLARGTAGADRPRNARRRISAWPWEKLPVGAPATLAPASTVNRPAGAATCTEGSGAE